MPLFVFRRSGSRQRGGSATRHFSSSSDTESGSESPRETRRETFFSEPSAAVVVDSAPPAVDCDYPDTSAVVTEDIIHCESDQRQQSAAVEELVIPGQQSTVESGSVLPSTAAGYSLSVEEEIQHYGEESDLTTVSQQETGTLSRSQTKDEITDTDDLLTLSKPHQQTNITPSTHQEYVIKTYTCQPISKMDVREALVGTNKKFECQVIGFPPPTIRWFKDNVEITHDPRYHFSHNHEDGVVSMHIEVIKLSDAGLYQCRAENCEGYAITAAHLQVKGW